MGHGTRPSHTGIPHAVGECRDCPKEWSSRNAVGLAAQHADKTGHHVVAEQLISMSWNKPR